MGVGGLYPNLEAEMVRNGVTKADLARCLNVRYATVIDKMKGRSPFRLDEALKIKRRFFPHCDFESLFERVDPRQQAAAAGGGRHTRNIGGTKEERL
jgi:DNA-binding XRE family transcriptional regulator